MEISIDYLAELNDVQRRVVQTIAGPSMVIAGPGSGKTRVLTYRIAHLIQSGVAPNQILALTFTNRAAREMKERISRVVGSTAQKVWAGTFHSIFARILRVEADLIGYPRNFTIYDRDDSKNLINSIVNQLSLDKNLYPANAILSRISSCKGNLITPQVYSGNAELLEQDRFHRRPMIHKIYDQYCSRCKFSGAMDFDDLLLKMFELLQHNPENVLSKYRNRFDHVLVDEFQDTNYLQYAIIKKLVLFEDSSQNICVVGDDAQSIYAFRGASIHNMLNFKSDFPNLNTFKLEQNYRSTHYIVEAANTVIHHNQKQIQKKIWTDQKEGQKIRIIRTLSDSEEGRRVADLIIEYKNRYHISNREIAILYRTNAQSRVFEEYLRRFNLPYRVFGGLSFYQRKEVKDLIAYLRLAVNPEDDEALRRVINYPKRGIGSGSIDKFSKYALENQITLWQSLKSHHISTRVDSMVNHFQKLVSDFQKKASTSDAAVAADYIAHRSGIIEDLRKDNSVETHSRMENINSLLNGVQEFIDYDEADSPFFTEDKTLASYLQNIALLTDLDEGQTDRDYITLMSAHSAKGLEFDAIFVSGLEENIFPSFQALEEKDGLDEERRLFYVAITRARKLLTLTYANSRYRFGKVVNNAPSRFLEEISPHLIDQKVTATAPRPQPRIQGNFKLTRNLNRPADLPSDFVPASPLDIQSGMSVRHIKFGTGKVISVDGSNENRVATIFFRNIESPQRRIMLKFAKLEILED